MAGHRKFEKKKALTAADLRDFAEKMQIFQHEVRDPKLDTEEFKLISTLESLRGHSTKRRSALRILKKSAGS